MNYRGFHIVGSHMIEDDIFYTVEITEGLEVTAVYEKVMGEQELTDTVMAYAGILPITYNEDDDELYDNLRYLKLQYVELQLNADGSGEHDVNLHTHKFYSGELELDNEGTHVKTYKREASAIKFAKSFGLEIVYS